MQAYASFNNCNIQQLLPCVNKLEQIKLEITLSPQGVPLDAGYHLRNKAFQWFTNSAMLEVISKRHLNDLSAWWSQPQQNLQ